MSSQTNSRNVGLFQAVRGFGRMGQGQNED